MNSTSNGQVPIIRTERGLTIAETRITLSNVMDYVKAGYPSKFIGALFDLSEEQINAALAYIAANQTEVEYQQVLQEAEELRQSYEEQNRDRVTRIATLLLPLGLEAAWEKLQTSKVHHQF